MCIGQVARPPLPCPSSGPRANVSAHGACGRHKSWTCPSASPRLLVCRSAPLCAQTMAAIVANSLGLAFPASCPALWRHNRWSPPCQERLPTPCPTRSHFSVTWLWALFHGSCVSGRRLLVHPASPLRPRRSLLNWPFWGLSGTEPQSGSCNGDGCGSGAGCSKRRGADVAQSPAAQNFSATLVVVSPSKLRWQAPIRAGGGLRIPRMADAGRRMH